MIVTVSALLFGGGAVLVSLALAGRRQRQVADLRSVLELRTLEPGSPVDPAETSRLLARAGLVTERALGSGNTFLRRAGEQLERSDWTLSGGEFVALSGGAGLLAGLLGFVLFGAAAMVLFGVVAAGGPYALVSRSVARRRHKFDEQFPSVLDLLAASLESGSSLAQALDLVATEADSPAAEEFARVLAATRLGATLTEALQAASTRLDSPDLDWMVQAVTVQQCTGGRLAEILRVVANTMRERAEVRRELSALTAEGRLSAVVLGGLPFLLGGFLMVVSPHYLAPLVTTTIGLVMLAGAAVLMAGAIVVMIRIVRVEV